MPHSAVGPRSTAELPAVFDGPQGSWRMPEREGMNVEYMSFRQEVDPARLLNFRPDSLCPCPHWGYMIKGQVRFVFADHEEVCNAVMPATLFQGTARCLLPTPSLWRSAWPRPITRSSTRSSRTSLPWLSRQGVDGGPEPVKDATTTR